ncbi:MAG: cob(I)yrinic acid a,c-diamide adenosyltransferase [Armatimonadetes bacterium]|nr:cob(I)yrinic acid a,c-diamide adenosyltransferase [Armatimonadota bacterium]
MKIYTKAGDGGQTGLIGGRKVSKADVTVGALGDLDELNACLGIALAHSQDAPLAKMLGRVQRAVFDIGAEVASPQNAKERRTAHGLDELTRELEDQLDEHERKLPPLKQFILPGGTILSAHLHNARTVCRRAERSLVRLTEEAPLRPELVRTINRLSDWLFSAARAANQEAGVEDVFWHGDT